MSKWQNWFFEAVDLNNLTKMKEAMISPDVNINAKGDNGKTALIFAAENGFHLIVEELIKAKADLNLTDWEGKTALIVSVERYRFEIAKALIKAGADVFKKDNEGFDAYHYAMTEGDLEMIKMIKEAAKQELSKRKVASQQRGGTALQSSLKTKNQNTLL
ncbi:MAG: ankyrin repeat domain-containing protein [Alphaproteobacteria bacterium]|nr:ankyrin repeat domain-containing protein [Alphaproteobacteria bacterium]